MTRASQTARDMVADLLAEQQRLRMLVLRQWAMAHATACDCATPDTGGCAWPVPIPHTWEELNEVLADA